MVKIYPETILKKALPKGFFDKNLLKKDFSLRQKAFQALILATTADKREITVTVAKVAATYQRKIDDLTNDGMPKANANVIAKNGEKLLRQRIEGLVIYDAVQQIKSENDGEKYRWLPSSSDNPDPQHQLLYGKIFNVGKGDNEGNMPGERHGCQCGVEILKIKNT